MHKLVLKVVKFTDVDVTSTQTLSKSMIHLLGKNACTAMNTSGIEGLTVTKTFNTDNDTKAGVTDKVRTHILCTRDL